MRTQISSGARYRVPDLLLCPLPLPQGRIIDVVPWAVVEILSPDDTLNQTRDRFLDYARLGVPHLILMDPEEYVTYVFQNGSLIVSELEGLAVPASDRTMPFRTRAILQHLRAERSEGHGPR